MGTDNLGAEERLAWLRHGQVRWGSAHLIPTMPRKLHIRICFSNRTYNVQVKFLPNERMSCLTNMMYLINNEAKSRRQSGVTSRANPDEGPGSPQNQRWYVLRGCDCQGHLRNGACFYGTFKRTKEKKSNWKNQIANSSESLQRRRRVQLSWLGIPGGRSSPEKVIPTPPILLCSVIFWVKELHSVPSLGHWACCPHFGLCWNKGNRDGGRHFAQLFENTSSPKESISWAPGFGFQTSIG